ncbi:MAG: LytTR family DNA-binding domain-containing protein [Bacilli bacterium]|nr:LytTR family DNA-binding domain-containing protein [Bacilli bacterium]
MIHVAIVDDQEQDRNMLKSALAYVAKERHADFVIDEFSSGEAFLFNFECQFDLVFLDIDMSGEDGIAIAHKLRERDNTVLLIFVTNMAQFVLKGYEVDALDFIIKPIKQDEFLLKMTRPLMRLVFTTNSSIMINDNGDLRSLRSESIMYITVNDHYVTYHTLKEDITEYISLNAAIKKMKGETVIYCNRQTVVNLRYISAIQHNTCVLTDGSELEISRSQKKSFIKEFASYLGGQS